MKVQSKKYSFFVVTVFTGIALFAACHLETPVREKARLNPTQLTTETAVNIDLDKIKENGKLVALTQNSSTSYFVYRGQAMGYEYELLSRFAKHLGVELEIKIIEDVSTMFELLNNGSADIIACNLAVTKDRLQKVAFSNPYNFTRQVLIQKLPDAHEKMSLNEINEKILTGPIQLIGKKVHVNKTSSFYSRLQNLENEIGGEIDIISVPGYIETEELIEKVASGEIKYTVADDNIAKLNQTYFPNIDISVQLSFPQQIAWAFRKNSDKLLREVNNWMEEEQHKSVYRYIYNKYFKASKEQLALFNSEFSSLSGNRISEYDELLKEYSGIIDWDWRLLAAQMYQESRFDREARSWAGAFGLMQFMPATAEEFGIDTNSTDEQHIRGAILYLSWLNDFWKERIFDEQERIKFILASYNAGLGHVLDAQSLAIDFSLDPLVWNGNVAECILLKSNSEYYLSESVKYGYCRGREPYEYVKKIMAQYKHYQGVIS